MPSEKKGGQGQSRDNGGVNRGAAPQPGWQSAQGIREGAEQVGQRIHEGYDAAREGVARGYRRAEGSIARNPGSSVLVGFGLGFGLGVVMVSLFAREHETWADRHIPDSIRHIPDSIRDMHLGDQVRHVPEHVHHLADAIVSHLPRSVRKYLA